jgi:hypothetical protein
MAHSNKEMLSIIWCDNGTTDGKFTEGLVYTLIHAASMGVPVNNAVRVQGNQIARQRQAAIEMWQKVNTDWALWVDSDIVLTKEMLKSLWDAADKVARPIVSGVYFISKNMEGSLMQPMPCVFNETGNEYEITYLHPLPKNQIVKVDNAGMGLVLMHKSVLKGLNDKFPDQFWFGENNERGEKFIGEDISFFRKVKAAGIPVHAHTGVLAKHMKRFAFDEAYYNLYWAAAEAAAERRERDAKSASSEQA